MSLPDEAPAGSFEGGLAAAMQAHAALVARLDELGDEPVERFLRHVRDTVPYYATCGPRLGDFPLIDRDVMRSCRDQLLSTTHAGEIEHLRARTNGTLASPLVVGFDPASFYELFHFSFARMVASRDGLREMLVPGEVGVHYVHDEPGDPRQTSYLPALGGVLLRRWPFGRGDEDAQTVRELRDAAPKILYAKSTILLRVAELDRSLGGSPIRPTIILTSGAPLYPRDRRVIEDWYGCAIINAYTATEGGLIAIECESGSGMHVLDDRVRVEILAADGQLRDEGTGEIVITGFINWAQPFVRYRLGDHGTLAPACPCGWDGAALVELIGRDVQAYDIEGCGRVESARFAAILERDDIQQYEVAQPEPARLLVRWIPARGSDASQIAAEIEPQLRGLVGAHVEVRRVEQITIAGGKGLRFVHEPRFEPRYD